MTFKIKIKCSRQIFMKKRIAKLPIKYSKIKLLDRILQSIKTKLKKTFKMKKIPMLRIIRKMKFQKTLNKIKILMKIL